MHVQTQVRCLDAEMRGSLTQIVEAVSKSLALLGLGRKDIDNQRGHFRRPYLVTRGKNRMYRVKQFRSAPCDDETPRLGVGR